jgi:hypothetical protein
MTKYHCKHCNYETDKYSNWKKHLETNKHLKNTGSSSVKQKAVKAYICSKCNKEYKHKSRLVLHETKCYQDNKNFDLIDSQNEQIQSLTTLLEKSIHQNQENLEKLLPKVGNITNNINNEMTINVFLNEQCQHAMNISDFVEKIKLTVGDLYYTRDNGYAEGISNIFVKNLNEIPETERPIHCSHANKLVFYVKDENEWQTDNENNKINKSIVDISRKQLCAIKMWENEHPNWQTDDKLTTEYINIVKKITSIDNDEKNLEHIHKIIGNNTTPYGNGKLQIVNK